MICVEPSSMIPMKNKGIDAMKLDCRGMLELRELRYDVLLIIQVNTVEYKVAFSKSCKDKQDYESDLKSKSSSSKLFKSPQAIHNITVEDDLVSIFRGILAQLNPGGRVCVVTRPDTSEHLPFFEVV